MNRMLKEVFMYLLELFVVLFVMGILFWLVNYCIPMKKAGKRVLNVVIVILAIAFILSTFGVMGENFRFHLNRTEIMG